MALTTAEKNRRKRERKKREREEQRKLEEEQALKKQKLAEEPEDEEVEVEYVAETAILPSESMVGGNETEQESMASVLKRFQQRAAVVTDDERNRSPEQVVEDDGDEDNEESERKELSKRKLRELSRPSVAELKRRVKRPDLVEAHDVTAPDPDFLIHLKGVAGTVAVPRHWGRKRKYLQGKRGIEKPPFQLPDFIVKTGITEIRDTLAEDESKMSAKQRNRSRVAPKMGGIDVDYRTLHDAFFKYQTKPDNLTSFGDLYYEGKEFETHTKFKAGAPLSAALREALGMVSDNAPPPWLVNMQRYGPPPSYPALKVPGLNAPLPDETCQYGYHTGGWGKPPVDGFGRPLYGGNPFAKPGGGEDLDPFHEGGLVTSDGKTIGKATWGSLPTGDYADEEEEGGEESSEEESSDEEMESEDEEEKEVEAKNDVAPPTMQPPTAGLDLRKQAGDETPLNAGPKQLYTVLQQKQADEQEGAVFASDVAYDIGTNAAAAPEGAESVLSKAIPSNEKLKTRKQGDDDEEDLGKFKF